MTPAGLYIHIPFCKKKCAYCDFYSVCQLDNETQFIQALEKEMAQRARLFPLYDTIYIGGGTPSLLTEKSIRRLFTSLFHHFSVQKGAEITLEINPGDLKKSKLEAWKDVGINRLSIGVQSFNDKILDFLGRRHNGIQAKKSLVQCMKAGFDHISCDLLMGLPTHLSPKTPIEDLKTAIATGLDHLSLYLLTVAAQTPLAERVKQSRGDLLPRKEEKADQFVEASKFLDQHGFEQYEVSNFSKGHSSKSKHNLKYWSLYPYLGLGPGAHSFDGHRRWWNLPDLEGYTRSLLGDKRPKTGEEILTEPQKRLECLMLGLRTSQGIGEELANPDHKNHHLLFHLIDEGLLRKKKDRFLPTTKGLLLADGIAKTLF